MKRTFSILTVLVFVFSVSVSTTKCWWAYRPLQKIVKLEPQEKETAGQAESPLKPCCAKEKDTGERPQDPSTCPIRLMQSQKPLIPGNINLTPELPAKTAVQFSSFDLSTVVYKNFSPVETPTRARSTPIILKKESFLI